MTVKEDFFRELDQRVAKAFAEHTAKMKAELSRYVDRELVPRVTAAAEQAEARLQVELMRDVVPHLAAEFSSAIQQEVGGISLDEMLSGYNLPVNPPEIPETPSVTPRVELKEAAWRDEPETITEVPETFDRLDWDEKVTLYAVQQCAPSAATITRVCNTARAGGFQLTEWRARQAIKALVRKGFLFKGDNRQPVDVVTYKVAQSWLGEVGHA